jgi:hypothetical protein
MNMELNKKQVEILDHTARRAANGRYCGDSPNMQALVAAGLMVSLGKAAWCPDEYFGITKEGREALAFYTAEKDLGDGIKAEPPPEEDSTMSGGIFEGVSKVPPQGLNAIKAYKDQIRALQSLLSYEIWWYEEGSAMHPIGDEDAEEHVHRVSKIAWSNGAYKERENK